MVEQQGRPVAVVDTVGAGDTFHAALLARLRQRGLLRREAVASLDEAALRDVLRYAVAASGVTCARRERGSGAVSSAPTTVPPSHSRSRGTRPAASSNTNRSGTASPGSSPP